MRKRLILFSIRLILLRGDYFFVIGGNLESVGLLREGDRQE
jgi:hypothetical protein